MSKRKYKKIVSVALSMIMLLSTLVLPEGVFAKDTLYPDADTYSMSRADISFEYMGTSSKVPGAGLPEPSNIDDFVWTPNSYVWVGVYVENMTRLRDMLDTDGLNSMVLSLLYDETYFTWDNSYAAQSFNRISGQVPGSTPIYPVSDWGYNVPHYVTAGATIEFPGYKELPEWVAFYPVSIPEDRYENLNVAKNTITYDNSQVGDDAQKMFSGSYLTDAKTLVAMFPLKMNNVAAPEAGTVVLEGVFNSSTFTIGSGTKPYLFVRDPANDATINLRNKFNIVNNVVDLFPAAGATHDVTVSKTTDTAATITVDPDVSTVGDVYALEEGKSYTFTATPSSKEYAFDNWSYNSEIQAGWVSTKDNTITITIPEGQTLTSPTLIANFKSNEYDLTVNGDNGTVSVEDDEGSPVSGSDNVYKLYGGETYTLSATASAGYKFSNWTSSDLTLNPDNNTAEVTFTMPTNDAAVTANFVAKTAPTISGAGTFDKNGGGDVTLTYSGDYECSGVTGLTVTDDYTIDKEANTITIKADYLKKQNTGAHELTFTFAEYTGAEVKHTITISNSAQATTEISKVSDPTKREYTYPETLNLDGLEFTVTTTKDNEQPEVKNYKYDGGWKTDGGYAGDPTDDGITLKFNDTDTTVATHGFTVMKQAQNGKAITIAKDGATSATTDTFTVHKKAITITSNLVANNVTKTYDGDNTVDGLDAVKTSLTVNDAVGSDNISVDTNGVNATYNDENAADNKTINVTGIAISGTNTDEYTFSSTLDIANAGQITKKDLEITAINNIPAIDQYTQTLTGNSTATQAQFTSTDVVSGDKVTVSYNYEYTSSQTSGTVNNVNVTNITITDGADKDNYNLTTQTLSDQAGTVNAATIASIEVTGQPTQTVDGTKATHGDRIDLSALEITVHYVGGATNVFTGINDITGASITLTWTDGGATVTGSEELRRDTHNGKTITATLNDKTATTNAFIVDKAVLTPSVSGTGITKVYDNTNTVPAEEKAKIAVTLNGKQATGDNVTATFDAVYAGVDVNASEIINITNIAPSDTVNYTVTPNTDNSLTGAITQRPLIVNITSVPSIFEGESTSVTLTETTHFTVAGKVSGDDVTVQVTGTYSSNSQGTEVPVTYAASITGGTSAGNYSVNAAPTGPNGTVLANGVKTIVIKKQPNKTEYTHGDKLDLNGLEFTTTTNGGEEKQYKFDNGAWVSDGTYDGNPNESTDENEVSVQYNGSDVKHNTTVVRKDTANNRIIITGAADTKTVALKVNAKELIPQISGSDIDKTYDGNVNASEFDVTAVIKDKDTEVVTGDDVSINVVSAVYPDKDKDDAPVNLTVDYELTGTHKDCYTLGTAEGNATGKINAKVVTINSISVPPIYVGAADLTVDVTQRGLADDNDLLLMANAGVTLNKVTATYPNSSAVGKPNVNINFDVTGNDKGNFTFATDPVTVTGEVIVNAMESFVVKTEPSMTYEYGDKFDFTGTVIEVTYTDGSTKDFTYDADKNKFVNGSEELEYTAKVTGDTDNIDLATSIVDTTDAGKTIEFTVTGINNSTAQTTGIMTVNKKKINEIHISATGETTKVYDATAAVNGTFAFEASNVVGSDDVSFTGVTYVYASKNAGKDIAITFNTDNIAVSNDKYELADTVTYKYYQDGAEQAGGLTGDITKRTVNITGITAGSTTVGNAGKVQATATIGTEEDKTAMLTDGIVVSVFVTYADEDVTAVGTPDVDVSYEVTLDPNTAKDNYNFVLESLAVSGNVTDNKITGLEIVKEPAKTQYEYGEKLDLTGVEVKVTYNDDPDNTETFVFDGTKWAVGGVEKTFPVDITWNSDDTNTPLDITNTTVTKTDSIKFTAQENVSVTTVTDVTGEITVGNAQLTVVAEGSAVKVYDGTTAVLDDDKNTITFKVTDKDGNVVSGVEILADAVYASKDAGEVQITFSNIRFADETNSGKYTLPTEIAPITGTINKRQLTIGTITVPSVKKGASATVTATNSTSFKLADTSLPIVEIDGKKDTVKISYTATYSSTATTGSNIAATIDNTTLAVTADDNAVKNYEIAPFTGTATGSVTAVSSGGGGGGGLAISISITKLNDETNEYEVVKDDLEGVVGDKITLGYEFSSNPANKEVEWLTSDEKIATVDENGVVTFVGEGEVEITVRRKTSTSTKDTVTIKVTQPEATPTPEVTPEPTERPSLVDKEILSPYIVGYEDGAFGPERTISREEVAAIFARLLVNKIDMDENYEVSFSDIPDTAWSKNYIGFLEDFGILNGYEDGTYRPYNSITRAEMAVIIAKVEGYDVSGTDMTTKFSDVDSGYDSWATQSIKVLTEDGVIEGYEDGTFRPGNGITRAETVSMINRILDAMEVEEIKVRPTDVTDAHWAYEDIIKAMNDRVLKDVAISNSPNGETEEN